MEAITCKVLGFLVTIIRMVDIYLTPWVQPNLSSYSLSQLSSQHNNTTMNVQFRIFSDKSQRLRLFVLCYMHTTVPVVTPSATEQFLCSCLETSCHQQLKLLGINTICSNDTTIICFISLIKQHISSNLFCSNFILFSSANCCQRVFCWNLINNGKPQLFNIQDYVVIKLWKVYIMHLIEPLV